MRCCFVCAHIYIIWLCLGDDSNLMLKDYVTKPLCGDGTGTVFYSLENYPALATMTHLTLINEIALSFEAWTVAANHSIRFIPVLEAEKADIVISFQPHHHNCVRKGCAITKDFPDTDVVLAHSFNPDGGSEIHMNGRITWLKDCKDRGKASYKHPVGRIAVFREILTHEIGHAMGIKHVKSRKSIMQLGYSPCTGGIVSIGEVDNQIMEMIKQYCHIVMQ